MAPRRAESDFGLQGWIDTLGLKQIFLIYSVYAENRAVKNYMKEDHRSNRRKCKSCGKESLKKKNQACTGFEPLTSAILVQRSYPPEDDDEVMNIWKSYKRMTQIIIIHSKCFAVSDWMKKVKFCIEITRVVAPLLHELLNFTSPLYGVGEHNTKIVAFFF